jgi:putative PEP-CTERM system histidine kinase
MVANAQKHKHNPEFIDDMVSTVSNTVMRMSKLMTQLRSGSGQTEQQKFELAELLNDVVNESRHREPAPKLILGNHKFKLTCDRDRLQTVFSHLVQNAQEATDKSGVVIIRLLHEHGAAVVEVEDSGTGMDEEFVRHRLFKPFDSTKGLTGMGIGAFESRDFIHSLGGNIHVQSTPGSGSLFRVSIPCSVEAINVYENATHKVNVS